MAVIKRGILGGMSGKVANVVGGTWKGVDYIRSLPLSVANPNTAAQQEQRGKFGGIVSLGSTLLTTTIKPLWDRFAVKMSGYNAFVQANIENWDIDKPLVPIDFILARGSLTGIIDLAAAPGGGNDIIPCTWTDNSGTGTATATDVAYLIAMNVTQNNVGVSNVGFARSGETANITMPTDAVIGDEFYVYACFRTANGFKVSDSAYFNVTL
jgi:hypothetical protein